MQPEIIGELGINHSGDINIAKQLITKCRQAGCSYVKFQKRDINLVYTKEELESKRESPWGTTFREQKEGLEIDRYQYNLIDEFCKQIGILWFASVWDINSFHFIDDYESVPFIKIPSALITKRELLEEVRDWTNKGIIISTGMSTIEMVDEAIDILGKEKIYCIMMCTSTYPSKSEELNLNCIKTYKERYPWAKIGFSNHHPGLVFMPVAVALGAEMIEFHVTLSRSSYGSDQASSIEPEGVQHLCKWIRSVTKALGTGVKCIYPSEELIIKKLRR